MPWLGQGFSQGLAVVLGDYKGTPPRTPACTFYFLNDTFNMFILPLPMAV